MTQKLSIIKGALRWVPIAIVFLSAAFLGCGQSDQTATESTGRSSSNAVARVSGGDPAVLAADVALTVYPATTAAQRPKSVSLVPEDSWQDAVAAAVFMAHPLRAPLLISSAGGMPEPTTAAVNLLQPHGNRLKPSGNASRNGAPYFAIGTVATPYQGRTYRTGETDGAPQAASIEEFRKVLFREAPKRVLIVPEDDSAFALPAAAWAAHSGDPVLFTSTDELPKATIGALERFPARAYVLGPPSVISPSVLTELRKLAKSVKRISGETPAENAIAFARYADGDFGWNVDGPGHALVIARSDEPLEAALSSPLSASGTPGPLLLTEGADTLPASLRGYLDAVGPADHVWLVGDKEAIAAGQEAEVEQLIEAGKR